MRRKRFPGEFIGGSQMNRRTQVNRAQQGSSSFWPKGVNDYGRPNSNQSSPIDPWSDWTNYPLVAWPQSAYEGNQPHESQGQYTRAYIPQQANYTAGYFVNPYEQQEVTPMMSASFMAHARQDTSSTMADNGKVMPELTVDSPDTLLRPGENPSVDSAEKSKSGEGLTQPVQGNEMDGEYKSNLEDEAQRAYARTEGWIAGQEYFPDGDAQRVRAQAEGEAESEGFTRRTEGDERMNPAGSGKEDDDTDVYQKPAEEDVKEDAIKENSGSEVSVKGEEHPTVDRAMSIQTMEKEETEPEEAGRQGYLSTEEKSGILVWKNFPK